MRNKNFKLAKIFELTEDPYHLLIENIKDYAIYIIDPHGYIVTWNRGAERIKQYPSNEVIGKHFSIFYTEEDKKRNHPAFELAYALKNGRYEEEGWRVRKHGSLFWANVVITPLYNDAKELVGFGKITRDLTERKKIEDLKSEFISVVSHELRTPITSIKGALGLLEETGFEQLTKKNQSLLNIALINCDRLTRLVNDVLDLEKLQEGKSIFNFKAINLKNLIEEAVKINEMYSIKYGVSIVVKPLNDVYIYADFDRIIQVLTNLLSNAIKFSLKGASVEISMQVGKKDVTVAVTDYGLGIPEHFKTKIFQRFAQLDTSNSRQKEGTGLGLAISKAIVERHSGTLEFESIENKHTTFYFKLPLAKIEL